VGRRRKARVSLPSHVHCVTARGREYFYFHPFRGTKRTGQRVALPGAPADANGAPNPSWWAAYRALAGEPEPCARPGTFAALIPAYKDSPEWKQLAAATRRNYAAYLTEIEEAWGDLMVAGVEPRHILALRDARAATPAAANSLVRTVSALFSWSVPRDYRYDNPCRHIRKLRGGGEYAPWTWDHIVHFRDRVSYPELWWGAALALYSGQRQSNVLRMPWSDSGDNLISVVQDKTGKKLSIPMHRDLRAELPAIPRRATTILTSTRGLPWTGDGFRASWNKEMARAEMAPIREAGLVFHGLRKSAVVFLLEAGCTDAEVSAITGQSRQMVEHYARMVNQRKLAAAAVLKWEAASGPSGAAR